MRLLMRARRVLDRLLGRAQIVADLNSDLAQFEADPIGQFIAECDEIIRERALQRCDHGERGVAIGAAVGGGQVSDDAALERDCPQEQAVLDARQLWVAYHDWLRSTHRDPPSIALFGGAA